MDAPVGDGDDKDYDKEDEEDREEVKNKETTYKSIMDGDSDGDECFKPVARHCS